MPWISATTTRQRRKRTGASSCKHSTWIRAHALRGRIRGEVMSTTAQEEWAGTRTYARRLVKGRAGVLLKVVSRGTPDTPNSAHGHRPTVRTGPFQTCAYNDTIQACAVCTGREACDLLPVALVACRLRRRSGDVAEGGVVQSLARLRRRAQFKANANACQRIQPKDG